MKPTDEELVEVTGKFFKELHRSADGTYCVCLYSHKKDVFTAVGVNLPEVNYPVTFKGKWVINPKFGRQFQVEIVSDSLPSRETDLVSYIASLHIGIGVTRASAMIQLVGLEQFWNAIETDPMQFLVIKGINEKSLTLLQDNIRMQTVQKDLFMLFGNDLHCDAKQYKKICSFFDNRMSEMLESITQNPYILMNCDYTFSELDYFTVRHTAYAPNDNRRLYAAAVQSLLDAKTNAHVGLPKECMIAEMTKLLKPQGAVPPADLSVFLDRATVEMSLIYSNELFYLPRSYEEETYIAEKVAEMVSAPLNSISTDEFKAVLDSYSADKGFSLSADQMKAVYTALSSHFCIITGGPGTGKSTILDALLVCWKHFYDDRCLLMAPTGKAAVRMNETTGHPAGTIHSALGLTIGNERTDKMDKDIPPVNASLIVVDECSMLDQSVMASILAALDNSENLPTLVLVGDPEQLPSVGWGNVLADMIQSNTLPVCKLNTIYRQGEDSPIITNATKIQSGNTELDFTSRAFQRLNYGTDEQNMDAAAKFYARCVRAYGIENVALLSPYHKATDICTNKFNQKLQEVLNPYTGQQQIKVARTVLREGDRVMQLKNIVDASNGDIGTVQRINPTASEAEPCVTVAFENGNTVSYLREQLMQLDLAYAISIHKSQGSQYPAVITVLPNNCTSFLKRNLLYTAITRSSKNVALFSPTNTIQYCINNNRIDERHTRLSYRLKMALSQYAAA